MMKVANPIYDIVFKYLLEDERIASDAKIRHDMNVEDEFFSVIEKRDTDIMLKDKKIAEQNTQIAEQWSTICTSVKMLHSAGMNAESIAMNLNLDLEKVRQMIKE